MALDFENEYEYENEYEKRRTKEGSE